MNDLANIVSLESIETLQAELSKYPQVELVTNHYFANGMYCRELLLPAGTILVGKVHKQEHFFMVTQGTLEVASEEGRKHLIAPSVLVSRAGIKRAGIAITDVTCITVHRTFETDIDLLEKELVEHDPLSLYDAHNRLVEKQ